MSVLAKFVQRCIYCGNSRDYFESPRLRVFENRCDGDVSNANSKSSQISHVVTQPSETTEETPVSTPPRANDTNIHRASVHPIYGPHDRTLWHRCSKLLQVDAFCMHWRAGACTSALHEARVTCSAPVAFFRTVLQVREHTSIGGGGRTRVHELLCLAPVPTGSCCRVQSTIRKPHFSIPTTQEMSITSYPLI